MLQKNRKWKKRILSMALLVIVAFSVVQLDYIMVGAENAVAKESGEVPEGYEAIYTIEDLYGIRNNPDGDYILMNDIDMTEATSEGGDYDCGTGWEPIEGFSGTLNGNGYRIIGLHIFGQFNSYGENIGLFGTTKGATIQGLGMVQCSFDIVSASRICVGSIVAYSDSSNIVGCYSSGNIRVAGIEDDAGDSIWASVGGLAGLMRGFYGMGISDCYNCCSIDCSTMGIDTFAGGICGQTNECDGPNISQCYNAGEVEGENAGAICGDMDTSYRDDYIINCNYLRGSAAHGVSTISSDKTVGCILLTEAQMKTDTSFVGYDFSDVWEVDTYCSYKYPQLKDNRMVRILSIRLAAFPEKAIYNQGDELDLAGAEIEIHYEDGKVTVPVVPSMLGSYDMNQLGKQSIPIVYGGKETAFDIEVKKVELNYTSINLNVGESIQLQAKLEPEGSTDVIQWKIEDSSVATVENGKVTAIGVGETTITAYTESGIKANCIVIVLLPAKSISLSQTAITLNVGESVFLEAKIEPEGSTDTIEWKTEDSTVATVENSKVTAAGTGRTIVTAYTESGVKENCTVTVLLPAKSMSLSQTDSTLNVGESVVLEAKLEPEGSTDTIEWKTEDSTVAIVENGKVTATGVGETTITAYTESGIETDCVVTVLLPAKSVSLSQTAVTLNVGENIVLEAKLEPEGSTDTIEWKTGNPVVATVENGKVTAIGAGRTIITAYTENGIETNCTVTVLLPAKAVNLGQTSITLNVGESVSLEAKLEPNGSTDTIQWKTGNPAVVTVANGKVTAIGAGRTIVTAYTESGIAANCIVTVAEKKKTDDTTGELDKTVLPNVKIKSVKNKKGKKIALKLSGAVNCDGYKIQYGLKKNFKGAKTISSKKDTVTIKKLKLKKNYYIRVRVYKEISGKTYYGKWSARKSVKIKK